MTSQNELVEVTPKAEVSSNHEVTTESLNRRLEELEKRALEANARVAALLLSHDENKRRLARTRFIARVSVEVLLVAAACVLLAAAITLKV